MFLLNTAKAQYVNVDSLHVLEGNPLPVSIAELDSIEMISPDMMPDFFFYRRTYYIRLFTFTVFVAGKRESNQQVWTAFGQNAHRNRY